MEIAIHKRVKTFFLKDARPFTSKREINWFKVKFSFILSFIGILFLILLWPVKPKEELNFHEKTESGIVVSTQAEIDPTSETVNQLQTGRANTNRVHSSLDYLYREDTAVLTGNRGSDNINNSDRNTTMILSRDGNDAKIKLLPGTKFLVTLTEKVVISDKAIPVIGIITKDVIQENDTALPQGTKLVGDISFDESSERALINWKSVVFDDGRERPLSGVGVGFDGQIGVEGNVKSEHLKNVVGQTVTHFIGAYAEGSMSKGQFGATEGGHENGIKNAVAETAKYQANSWGEEMSKEKKWIELKMGTEFYTVLNQPFVFRDPGATNGR